MASRRSFKTTFEAQKVIQPIHAGGNVATDAKGEILATCLGEEVLLTSLQNGESLARIGVVGSLTSMRYVRDRTDLYSRMEKC